MQIVYVVIGYCNHYPAPDNTLGVFNSYQSAADFRDQCEKDHVNWCDYYDICEHRVHP